MSEKISHLFKTDQGSKEIIFERVGHLIDLDNSSDNFSGYFKNEINKNNDDYVIHALSPFLFEIDVEKFMEQTTPQIRKQAHIINTYSYKGNIYKFENKFKEFIVKIPSSYTKHNLEVLLVNLAIIVDESIFNYFLVGVYSNKLEEVKNLFDQNNIEYEANWQTVYDTIPRNMINISSQYIEERDLPPNPAFVAINYDKNPTDVEKTSHIKIALLDNGIQGEHPDLREIFDSEKSQSLILGEDSQLPNRKETHGTRCAGILAGFSRNRKGILGTGAGSTLISYRIIKGTGELGREYYLSNFNLIKAFLLAYKNECSVINCSWTLPYESTFLYDVIEQVASKGRDGYGITIVFSAGNKGSEISFPANCTNSITVSAVDLSNRPYIYSWKSNYGDKILIAAPGVKVHTTDFVNGAGGDHVISQENSDLPYVNHSVFDGTSAAAPIIAGFIAQIYQKKEACSLEEIKNILKQSCEEIDHTHNSSERYYGCGVIDYRKLKSEIANL